MRMRWWSAVVALALGLTACTSGSAPEHPAEPEKTPCPGPPTTLAAAPGAPSLSGRVVLLAGANDLNADLYELRFDPMRLQRVTCEQRVSAFGGGSQAVVVAAAQRDVGYTDHIQQLMGDRLVPVDGLGTARGSTPDVGPDSRIVYTQVNGTKEAPRLDIIVFDPATKASTTLLSGDPNVLGGVPRFGPDGTVAVGRHEPSGDKVVLVRRSGRQDVLDPGVAKLGNIAWSSRGWLALDDVGTGSVLFDPRSKQRVAVPGWVVLAWSPDGTNLLVAAGDKNATLGIATPPGGTVVQKVSDLPVSAFGAVWRSAT